MVNLEQQIALYFFNLKKMKRKELYIIRHGQTDFNKNKIIQGRGVNSHLNNEGIEQAQRFYNHYHHLPFQKIQIRHIPFPALVYEKQHDFENQNSVNRTPVKNFFDSKPKFPIL